VDIDFGWGFDPDPTGELTALPYTLADVEGARFPFPKNAASARGASLYCPPTLPQK